MYTLGIDIGSTTSKCAVLRDGGERLAVSLALGGIGTKGPAAALESVLRGAGLSMKDMAVVAATGYGRTRCDAADMEVSELTCHALGAYAAFPQVRTVVDIGGQDAKVISLDGEGRMRGFTMNDKCAAGTGRFLDVMASVLQISLDELGQRAARAKSAAAVSSTCTVFAESEVISLLAGGVDMDELAAGICASVAGRVSALVKRQGVVPAVCMSGGVARNEGVRAALSQALGEPVLVSPDGQLFGAVGAAIYAYRKGK